ncbi:MAG TPA: hypothetical protein VFN49_12730 [Candidatus Aquilonibacter sp.]|nr:hypothetical protein [Candidatus Aquilonibacter sp.]
MLSCTIDKYAYVSLRPYDNAGVRVYAEHQGVEAIFEPAGGEKLEGKLDLAQAILQRFRSTGLECYIQSDAPPGSGLGSSSSMIVALIEAFSREKGLHLSNYDKAALAFEIERNDLGIIGGLQDQYAAAFGGFNFIEFDADGVHVTPLRLNQDVLSELHYHLLLCFTGKTRLSSNIVQEQTANVVSESEPVMNRLAGMKALTVDLKRALLKGRLQEFGGLLHDAWQLKRQLASGISNEQIETLYDAARAAGAIGGKILGAGGGGHMLLFAPFTRRTRVREAMERAGARIVDFQFEDHGATSWVTTEDAWVDGD